MHKISRYVRNIICKMHKNVKLYFTLLPVYKKRKTLYHCINENDFSSRSNYLAINKIMVVSTGQNTDTTKKNGRDKHAVIRLQ